MTASEIEQQQYIDRMRLKSIEASYERVAPFSAEFECLMNKALEIKKNLEMSAGELVIAKWTENEVKATE